MTVQIIGTPVPENVLRCIRGCVTPQPLPPDLCIQCGHVHAVTVCDCGCPESRRPTWTP